MLNFVLKYAECISWVITMLVAATIFLIFVAVSNPVELGNAVAITGLGLIMLFIADGSGGTREWPWKIDIRKMLQNEIAKQNAIERQSYKKITSIVFCFLYKSYANSAMLGLLLICIGLISTK